MVPFYFFKYFRWTAVRIIFFVLVSRICPCLILLFLSTGCLFDYGFEHSGVFNLAQDDLALRVQICRLGLPSLGSSNYLDFHLYCCAGLNTLLRNIPSVVTTRLLLTCESTTDTSDAFEGIPFKEKLSY